MSPDEFRQIRRNLGLSLNDMAKALGGISERIVRYYEIGDRPVSATVQQLLKYIQKYGIINDE